MADDTSWTKIPDWGQKLGEMFGLEGDRAKAVGTALMGSGLGALLDGGHGAVSGGALGAMLGGGGEQLGSLVIKDPTAAKLAGNALLGGIAGNQIKGVGGQGGATLAGLGTALTTMGGEGAEADPADPDSAESMRAFIRKYWPVLALGGAGMYSSYEDKQKAAKASLPSVDNYARGPVPSLSDIAPQGAYTPYEGDYFTYGQAPQHNFFKAGGGSVGSGLGSAMDELTSSTTPYVRGPGSGRSDSIPARLSDGEYVIDAETVALLGDGSSDTGAKKLDSLRARIRKQKGKKLVKGEISPDAKDAEHYLGGEV